MKKTITILIIFIVAILGILVIYYKVFHLERCEWKTINCCSENAGAQWKCVDKLTYKPKIDCSKIQVLCPQFYSPKPESLCVFENGSCVAK